MAIEIHPRSISRGRAVLRGVLFLASLVVLNFISIALLPGSYQESLRRATGLMAASILQPFEAATFDGLLLTTGGFSMEIAIECTAVHFLMIYIAGVVAYPHHEARYKVLGIAVGTMALISMNVVRIAVLGLVGAHVPAAFEFVHVYLWQGIFALLVVGVWIVWVRKPLVDRSLLMKIGTAVVVTAAGVGVLSAAMPEYLEALAVVARPIAGVLLGRTPYALTVSSDVLILDIGNQVVWTDTIPLTVYNQIIFLALMATSLGQGRVLRVVIRTLSGLGLFFLFTVGYVLLFVLEVAQGMTPSTIENLDVTVRMLMAGACIGIAVLFARKSRESGNNINNVSVDLKGGCIDEKAVVDH